MLRPYGLGFPGDAIAHRYGFDGWEPKVVRDLCNRYAHLGVRSTFAINTDYPEVQGAYFENRALYALIDTSLHALGLFRVKQDYYPRTDGGLIPVEGPGQLLVGDDYYLIDAAESHQAMLQTWQMQTNGGPYYDSSVIFDLVLPSPLTRILVDDVERQCTANGVQFRREASLEVT